MDKNWDENGFNFDDSMNVFLGIRLLPFSFLFKNLLFCDSEAYKQYRKEELSMSYTNDDIGYIGGVPGPGKRYVAGVGYVDATEPQGIYVAGQGYVVPDAPGTWKCSCGTKNTGKFCQACGKSQVEPEPTWTCECGVKNTGKFCNECGKAKPEAWTCECGHKNTGKFCNECGKAKPEVWTCECGAKNTGKFCNECGKAKGAPTVEETFKSIVDEIDAPINPTVIPGMENVEAGAPVNKIGAWVCSACGEENTTKFCLTCGAKAPEAYSTEPVVAPIVEEAKPEPIAPVVEEVKLEPAPVPVVEEVKPEPAPIAGAWTCAACGEVNTTKFCLTCGAKAPEAYSAEPVVAPIVEEVKSEPVAPAVEVKPEPTPVPVVEEVKPAPTPVAGGWTCPACGELNTGKFCNTCGMKKPANVEIAVEPVVAPIVEETKPEPVATPIAEEVKPEPVAEPKLAHILQCPACGWIPADPANAPKFCIECGSKLE